MTEFKPFTVQRMGGPVTENPGYPSASIRGEIRRKALEKEGQTEAIWCVLEHTRTAHDDFLFHQYYLRDMAYVAIDQGNLEEAKHWLAQIGEDK